MKGGREGEGVSRSEGGGEDSTRPLLSVCPTLSPTLSLPFEPQQAKLFLFLFLSIHSGLYSGSIRALLIPSYPSIVQSLHSYNVVSLSLQNISIKAQVSLY